MPIGIVTGTILVSMIPIGLLLYAFGNTAPIAANPGATIVLSIIYTLIAGVVIAAVCGYMAGLIGASNSPISGVGILSVLGISLILAALFPGVERGRDQGAGRLRLVRHGDHLRRRDHLQQQPPGPEDRPAGRGDAVAAAGRAGARRRVRRAGHSADPRPHEHCLHLPGRARRQGDRACRAAGGDHLDHRAGRARRQPRLGPDPRKARSSALSPSSSTKA